MSTQLMNGTTAECLSDFVERWPLLTARNLLAEFAGVEPGTIDDWLRGIVPRGWGQLKLRCFLDLAGYTVKELEELPDDNLKLARLLALDVASLETVRQTLKYTSPQPLYQMTLRGTLVMPSKALVFERLLKSHAAQVETARAAFSERMAKVLSGQVNNGSSPAAGTPASEPAPVVHPGVIPNTDDRLPVVVAHSLQQSGWLAAMLADQGPQAKELFGIILGETELRNIVSRIEKLLPDTAPPSA